MRHRDGAAPARRRGDHRSRMHGPAVAPGTLPRARAHGRTAWAPRLVRAAAARAGVTEASTVLTEEPVVKPPADPKASKTAPAFWAALPDPDAVIARIRRMCRLPNWVPAWDQPAVVIDAPAPARETAPAPAREPTRETGYRGRAQGALGRRTVALRAYCLELHAAGYSNREIADATGLHRTTIGRIVPGRSKAEAARLQWQRRRERAGERAA